MDQVNENTTADSKETAVGHPLSSRNNGRTAQGRFSKNNTFAHLRISCRGGRPKLSDRERLEQFKARIEQVSPQLFERVMQLTNSKDERVALTATTWFLQYLIGRPPKELPPETVIDVNSRNFGGRAANSANQSLAEAQEAFRRHGERLAQIKVTELPNSPPQQSLACEEKSAMKCAVETPPVQNSGAMTMNKVCEIKQAPLSTASKVTYGIVVPSFAEPGRYLTASQYAAKLGFHQEIDRD